MNFIYKGLFEKDPEKKKKLVEELNTKILPSWFSNLEKRVGENYSVGNSLTISDLKIYCDLSPIYFRIPCNIILLLLNFTFFFFYFFYFILFLFLFYFYFYFFFYFIYFYHLFFYFYFFTFIFKIMFLFTLLCLITLLNWFQLSTMLLNTPK